MRIRRARTKNTDTYYCSSYVLLVRYRYWQFWVYNVVPVCICTRYTRILLASLVPVCICVPGRRVALFYLYHPLFPIKKEKRKRGLPPANE